MKPKTPALIRPEAMSPVSRKSQVVLM